MTYKVSITIAQETTSKNFDTITEARNYAQEQHIVHTGYINNDIQTWQGEDRTDLNGIAGRKANYTVAVFIELSETDNVTGANFFEALEAHPEVTALQITRPYPTLHTYKITAIQEGADWTEPVNMVFTANLSREDLAEISDALNKDPRASVNMFLSATSHSLHMKWNAGL